MGPSTCFACFQDSSHCLMVLFASSSSCRSRASSAAPGPDRKAGDVPGEKLPEAKCSQILLFIPFRPAPEKGGTSARWWALPGPTRGFQGQPRKAPAGSGWRTLREHVGAAVESDLLWCHLLLISCYLRSESQHPHL